MSSGSVTLSELHTDVVRSTPTAWIDEEGNLAAAGHDVGPFVEERLGAGDYEYWLRVPAADLGDLARALLDAWPAIRPVMARSGLLDALRALWADGTFQHDAALRAWMDDRQIPNRLVSWR